MSKIEDTIIKVNQEQNRRVIIQQMFGKMKQYNVIASKVEGRKITTSDNTIVYDFASCNYLGLDLDPELQDYDLRIEGRKWGLHPSWCRLVASPYLYQEVEEKLAQLIGTETALIMPTITLISEGLIPTLVGNSGVLFLDKSGHINMYDAAKIARDSGATLESFPQENFAKLEELLTKHKDNPCKVILVDGVYSMSGDFANIPRLAKLASDYNAILYIDDAHGFGVVGEKPTKEMPYGFKGNGIVKYHGMDYENIIYIGGCSKAYSAMAAFIGCSKKMYSFIQAFTNPYNFSGPCQIASLAILKKGLEINEKRGDLYRQKLFHLTNKAIKGLRELGFKVNNRSGYPIVFPMFDIHEELIESANLLYDNGILVTVAAYPMVSKENQGHRISITAANTEEEVDHLLHTFAKVKKHFNEKS